MNGHRWVNDPEAPTVPNAWGGENSCIEVPPLRGLVIDDRAAIRELLCQCLGRLGLEVDAAESGEAGLALFSRHAYDLVLTDLMMPGMTGWEVTEAVRRQAPDCRVIMVTGSASNLDRDRAQELSLEILLKPFQLNEVRGAVEQALGAGVSKEAPVTVEPFVQDPGGLRTVVNGFRALAEQLGAIPDIFENLLRERDGHAARVRELEREQQRLREAHETLTREHRGTVAALTQLQSEHDQTSRALAELRDQHRAQLATRDHVAEELDTIARRLRQ